MASRTQDQIKASWNETDQVAVSVVCPTYNHELYIREALEGFLMQETNFPFEIIIHDDASTDSTATIIREYASKYPAIIRPIFQSENQYSKGGFKPGEYAAGFAKGEYIALCKGDDYWVDPKPSARSAR
jgi:glycosyltransferase involved in cell wall biosynthesis